MASSGLSRRGCLLALLAVVALALASAGVFHGIRAWKARPPRPSELELAAVEALRDRLGERWGDEPLSLEEARRRAAEEEAAGRQANAVDLLARAAASGDLEAELRLAIQTLRAPVPDRVRAEEARALVAVLGADSPRARLVPAARAWARLSQDDPVGALEALKRDEGTLEGRWARLRALLLLGQEAGAEADALLQLDPGHTEACEVGARLALAAGDLAGVRARTRACLSAGARSPVLYRLLGDASDAAGRYAEAAAAYAQAGAILHGAAIVLQEGLDDPRGLVAAALADPAPPAALFAVWAGLLRGELPAAQEAARRLDAAGVPGPEAGLAVAAARLAGGDARGALERVGGLGSAEALVLAGRARALLGEDAEAGEAFDQALRAEPWNLAAHREHLAWTAARRPSDLLEAARALAAVDPLTLGLSRDWRRRDAPWAALAPSPWPEEGADAWAVLLRGVLRPESLDEATLAGLEPVDRARLRLHRGWALAARGDLASARAEVQEALAASSTLAAPHALAAELALEAGDLPAAESLLAEALARAGEPTTTGAAATAWVRARLLLARGQPASARAVLLDAARANREHTGLWSSILALDEAGSIPAPGPDRLTAGLGSTR